MASFPELKALLGTDLATIRDFLLSYQQENKRSELLIILDPAGRVVARTDTGMPIEIPNAEPHWVQPALANQAATGILSTEQGFYHAAAVPAVAGGIVFGYVIAGARINTEFAGTLRDISQDEVVLVSDRIVGSTLPVAKLPWQTRREWEGQIPAGNRPQLLEFGDQSYLGLRTTLGPGSDPDLLAVILRSREPALAPYRRIQIALLALGLVAALAGITASALLARRVTASIGELVEGTRRVAAGDLDTPLDIRSGDEIGDLGQAFNLMMRGLRERVDMQKFVSQSTVEMIQRDPERTGPEGMRKQLTIFFSDIRRFTLMSETRAPEEVVRILNSCPSLQADKVKKFGGDIDKYVGDSVVALFSGEDSALNAIRCAIEIQRAVEAANRERPSGEQIGLGIGIVTGEVILGSIGSEDRRDFTAVGSNVNLCARLCSTAAAGEILLADSAYLPVRDLVAAERLEPQQVKGFTHPVPVYRIALRA